MTEREQFERWFSDDFMSGLDDAGEFDEERNCYVIFQVHMAWKGWQASRKQALEESALICDGLRDDAKEADALELFRLAESTGRSEAAQLSAGRFWLDVSTFNAGLRRAAAAIRDLATKARTLKKESA